MRSLLARSDDPVSVISTIASASSGGFTSVAPQLNSTFAAPRCPPDNASSCHKFRRDNLPCQILDALERRRFRNGQDPAHFAEALLGVNEIGDGFHLAPHFLQPNRVR